MQTHCVLCVSMLSYSMSSGTSGKSLSVLACDQVSKLLHYSPVTRVTALGALTHPFFDELRDPTTTLPNGEP